MDGHDNLSFEREAPSNKHRNSLGHLNFPMTLRCQIQEHRDPCLKIGRNPDLDWGFWADFGSILVGAKKYNMAFRQSRYLTQ